MFMKLAPSKSVSLLYPRSLVFLVLPNVETDPTPIGILNPLKEYPNEPAAPSLVNDTGCNE
jgi:hypothetical protein